MDNQIKDLKDSDDINSKVGVFNPNVPHNMIGLSRSHLQLMSPSAIQFSTFIDCSCSSCVKQTTFVSRCQYCLKQFCLNCFKEHSYHYRSCDSRIENDVRKHHTAKGELEASFQGYMKLCEKHAHDAAKDLNKHYSEEEMEYTNLLHDIENFGIQIGEFSELEITPQDEVKALFENATKAVDMTCQSTLNDFHEKRILAHEGFEASFNTIASENPKLLTENSTFASTSKSVFVQSHVPIKDDCVSMPRHQNYQTLTVKHRFGSIGQFSSPSGFCLGVNEDIIIADTNNHRIQVFDKNGTFKFKFGKPGKVEGNLWFPTKVAVLGQDSRFVISDQGVERARLQIFTQTGIFLRKICFFLPAVPCALNVTNEGDIVIVDKQRPSSVYIINESGALKRSFECTIYVVEPSDIAIHDNELFICDFRSHRVAVFNTAGVFQRYIGDEDVSCFPNGIHVTNEEVLVCNSNNMKLHIASFTLSGQFKEMYKCTQLKVRCWGLIKNSNGEIITLNRGYHNLLIMNNMFREPNK